MRNMTLWPARSGPAFVVCSLFALSAGDAGAAVLCATTASGLQTHLDTAEGNGVADEIRIAVGTYAPSATFAYTPVVSQNLTISGGWNVTCTSQRPDPALTVLDGQNARQVMQLYVGTTTAAVTVRYLTFQNGNVSGSGGGLSVVAAAGAGLDITVEHVVARGNSASSFGAGMELSSLGTLRLANSLVVDNVAGSNFAGVALTVNGTAATIVHNTVAGNTVSGAGTSGGVRIAGDVPAVFANNVFWGNEGNDLLIGNNNTYFLYANDVGTQTGSAAGGANNISVDPQFVGAGDYRLLPTSTLADVGDTVNAVLPDRDLATGPRDLDGGPDLGAYESEHLFSDTFECGSAVAWSALSPP